MPLKSNRYLIAAVIALVVAVGCLCYHIGYNDGYVSAMRQFIFSFTPAQPAQPDNPRQRF